MKSLLKSVCCSLHPSSDRRPGGKGMCQANSNFMFVLYRTVTFTSVNSFKLHDLPSRSPAILPSTDEEGTSQEVKELAQFHSARSYVPRVPE